MSSLEHTWSILVQGQLQLLNGINNVFLIQYPSWPQFLTAFVNIIIFYAAILGVCIIIAIAVFIVKYIANSQNWGSKNIYSKTKITMKDVFLITLILIGFPIIMFLIVMLFNFLFPLIINAIFKTNNINSLFLTNLYYVGSNNAFVPGLTAGLFFQPPAPQEITQWNFFVQIVVSNVIVFTFLYLLWTYFQKMVEIIILCITLPFSPFVRDNTFDIGLKIWIKGIINKIIVCMLCILVFYTYTTLIQVLINAVAKISPITKFVISVFVSIALLLSCIMFVNLFNQKHYQYKGIIKTINSLKDTIQYNFSLMQAKIASNEQNKNSNSDNSFVKNREVINNLKNLNKDSNGVTKDQVEILKKIEVF